MAPRIDANKLEQLIADDKVADEEIAKYLKRSAVRGLPFEPMLIANEATVDAPPTRGIVGLTVAALNARSNRRRLAAYQKRIASGWKGLKILAEGDSWFLYPILLRDIVDNLSDQFAIYSVAAAGDTLDNMVRGTAHIEELIEANGIDAMLFSAGGNDIAGDQLRSYLREVPGAVQAPEAYITETFDQFLASSKTRIAGVVTRLTKRFPKLQIFGHGYDWPFPQGQGIWLEPAFISRKIPNELRGPILKIMIDRYYRMLEDIAAQSSGQYHLVDCRGAVGSSEQWFDELHPFNPGFARAANIFRKEINRVFGASKSMGGEFQAKITWRPNEEATGARTRSRAFPQGASISIGRSNDREIVLDDDRVSRKHVQLTVAGPAVEIDDAGSSNGTFIDGIKVAKARWLPGQKLQIGPFAFEFELEPVAAPEIAPIAPVPPGRLPEEPKSPDKPLRSLEIVVAKGSITRQAAPAWAIGVFENVNPLATRGVARAIDEEVDGLLSDVLQSQIVEGRLGTVLPVPVPAERGLARNLFLAGLGAISEFIPKTVETAGESLARVLVATHIFELATIPIGMNCGLTIKGSIESFLTGFLRGLQQHDGTRGFRSVALCEVNADRYAELSKLVQELAATGYFKALGFDVKVREDAPSGQTPDKPEQVERKVAPPERPGYTNKIYVEVVNRTGSMFEYSLIGAPGASIPCFSAAAAVSDRLKAALDARSCPKFDAALGKELADGYLPAALQTALGNELASEPGHLLVIHDSASAAVPWEASFIGGRSLALEIGISRRHKPGTRSESVKHIERAKLAPDGRVRLLLVFDPTCDLTGAETEAHDLAELFKKNGCEIKTLQREECTKEAVLNELRTGNYDLLHFAGHGSFTQQHPEKSGVLLYNQQFLLASDLESLPAVPRLIFLNACQSGRVRSRDGSSQMIAAGGRTDHASLAEAFILRNVSQFVGTYWLVNDDAARSFAVSFYSELLAGRPVGDAIRTARQTLASAGLNDWVNYLHFGEPGVLLRKVTRAVDAQAAAVPADRGEAAEPDPMAGEGLPTRSAGVLERGNSELPISQSQAIKVTKWLRKNFGDAMQAAVQDPPFSVEQLCGIVCQETAYFWCDLIDKLPVAAILERCVLDACGDVPGTDRSAFPRNTAAFRSHYGDDFTQLLIDEANKTRAIRSYKPKGWVYKGYGLFQYDLQYVKSDEAFFRNREWHAFDACLAKAMGELQKKYEQTGDPWRAIRSYNGSGPSADRYARNVAQFSEWCGDVVVV